MNPGRSTRSYSARTERICGKSTPPARFTPRPLEASGIPLQSLAKLLLTRDRRAAIASAGQRLPHGAGANSERSNQRAGAGFYLSIPASRLRSPLPADRLIVARTHRVPKTGSAMSRTSAPAGNPTKR